MGEFPPELLFEILLRLPPEDLLRCLCVSKAWNATIHDKNFIKSHLQRSIQTNSFGSLFVSDTFSSKKCLFKFYDIYNDGTIEPAMKIEQPPLQDADSRTSFPSTLVSSNGIICIGTERGEDEDFVLWNPSIRKFKKVPSPTFEQSPSPDKHRYLGYGFGYDSTNDDYKLLGISNFNKALHECQIYSLKSNSWRKIRNMPCDEFHMIVSRIVFSNGALSWLAQTMLDRKMHVVTFELASEKYHWFPTPVDENVHLEVLGDSLCILRLRTIDAWIMKEHGSWTLLYSIERVPMSWCSRWEPILLSKNGESVLLMNDLQKFAWFDLVKNSWKEVKTAGLYRFFRYTICMRSLCLLDGDPIIVESSKSSRSKKGKTSRRDT